MPTSGTTITPPFNTNVSGNIQQDGYAVYAGPATGDFARDTSAAIKKRFGVDIDQERLPTVEQGNAAYGILLRDLKFKKKFFRSRKNALEFRTRTGETHRVEFFGTAGTSQ